MPEPSKSSVPTHIGIILDGNRRWAKAKGLPTLEGHRQGAEALKAVSTAAFRRGVKYLSAYVFSTENWSRTQKEVSYLMGMVSKVAETYLAEVHKAGIRVLVSGTRDGLDPKVLDALQATEDKTAKNTKGTMVLCFNYGGQQEIVDAAKELIKSGIKADKLDIPTFAKHLYNPGVPPVDLMIRTSGEQRISNFMLWRLAYSELYFTDKYWPDFNEIELDKAIAEYAHRQRRFGK